MRLAMPDIRSRLWIIPAAALVGVGGLALGHAPSALCAFAAVLVPSEWLRAKAAGTKPEDALALGLAKFSLTTLLLVTAAVGMKSQFSPAAYIFGVVVATVVGVFLFCKFPPQIAEIRGNS